MEEDEVVVDENEELRQFLPSGFGKQTGQVNRTAQLETARRAKRSDPVDPRKLDDDRVVKAESTFSDGGVGHGNEGNGGGDDDSDDDNDDGNDDDSDDDDDDDDPEDDFPVSHELVMRTHEKAVTTLTCDVSGTRCITGSTDCTIKLHDFASMTPTTVRAFKSVDPTAAKGSALQEVHPIHHVSFNPISPSSLLVVSATSQAKVFSRDGDEQLTFVKGDMYLRDMHNTKGHVSEITSGAWCPTDMNLLVTAGTDSTLRIWDVNNPRSQKEVIVHKSRAAGSGGRTRMTAVGWSKSSQGGPNLLIGAALDGSLAMWSGNGPFTRPAAEVRDAHRPDTWTSGISVSPDGRMFVTRGGDDTIKLWDTRKLKQPLRSVEHSSISSQYQSGNIAYSPTGTSILVGGNDGRIHILNPATLQTEVATMVTPNSPIVTVLWHEKLNQILTGSTDGTTHVLYRPGMSADNKGAAMVMARAPKRRHIDDDSSRTVDQSEGLSGDSIITPGSILDKTRGKPMTGLTASGRSRDPRRPHVPLVTPFAKSNMDEETINKNVPLSSMRTEDPREALLKYAEQAEKDPLFTKAYKETQPKTIYAEVSDEEKVEEPKRKRIRG